MASNLALAAGLWFLFAALLNVAGGDELLSFPRVIYVGLALISFALFDWDAMMQAGPDGPTITLSGHEPERPSDD